ncbi:MAG: GntR family transcriptional regulator [Desulfitobacteriaceae bacterium]
MVQKSMLLSKETLAQQSADVIYSNIINMKHGYEPGSRLSIKDLSEELGVSETPVKIALKLLESKEVVIIKPRVGTYIAELNQKDVKELTAVLSGLESLAVHLVKGEFSESDLRKMKKCLEQCELALLQNKAELYRENDVKFHRLIVGAAHNRRLDELYTHLMASEQIINVYSPRSKEEKEQSMAEHRLLLEKIQSNDERVLLEELNRHWKNSEARLLSRYDQYLKSNWRNAQVQED